MVIRRVWNKVRLYRQVALVEASPLFDKDYYLSRNPDVAASGLNPAAHYLTHGFAENRNPCEEFDNLDYLGRYPDVAQRGMNPLLHYLRFGAREGRQWRAGSRHATTEGHSLDALRAARFKDLRPLRVFTAPPTDRRRLTLLVDSIDRGSLYGGVGTSIIFAVLLAQRLGTSLRIVTQTQAAETGGITGLLQSNAIPLNENIEFSFTDRMAIEDKEIELRAGDLFVTTSWWSTANALAAIAPEQIIYLLQEDERMFYKHGDEHLMCSELLRQPGLRVVVNSQMLHAHLASDGLAAIARQNLWFEPAFPAALSVSDTVKKPGEKQLFFFYARPRIARNLYIRGLEAITSALEQGVLDPELWDFCFVGRDLEATVLPRGVTPKLLQSLPWPDYLALVRRVDLGLSLMYTPHPSYPPLDLAGAGAVVVTNRYGPKTSLEKYSPNILCVDPTVEGLVTALAEGAALAGDLPRRRANQARNQFINTWQQALAPVLDRLAVDQLAADRS